MAKWFKPKWRNRLQNDVDGTLKNRIEALTSNRPDETRSLLNTRFVVLDFETTGLNIRKDVPIALGAVTIENARIQNGRQFEKILFQPNTAAGAATLVHGIVPGEIAQGADITESLIDFYEYAKDAILIAFHAPFDKAILNKAAQSHLGSVPNYPFYDLEDIACAFYPTPGKNLRGLDAWCQHFGFDMDIDRHNASADAMISAELFLVCLNQAKKLGITTWGSFLQKIEAQTKLRKQQHQL
jgi:DNA polymerase-3 subunit epsilon